MILTKRKALNQVKFNLDFLKVILDKKPGNSDLHKEDEDTTFFFRLRFKPLTIYLSTDSLPSLIQIFKKPHLSKKDESTNNKSSEKSFLSIKEYEEFIGCIGSQKKKSRKETTEK